MLNPMSLEAFARDRIQARLDEAAHQALLDQLPHSPTTPRFDAARRALAHRLRGLAFRLDPSVANEPKLGLLIWR